MTRDDIIRMAREAGFVTLSINEELWVPYLERFFHKAYAAGAAAERENMVKDGWRRCAVGQRTTQFCGMLEDAVKAEREACARFCEDQYEFYGHDHVFAAGIRARGE